MLHDLQSHISLPLYKGEGAFLDALRAIDPAPHEVSGPTMLATLERYARKVEARPAS